MGNLTEVETARWRKIRKRVYLPEDVDEFKSSSSALAEITRLGFSDNKSEESRSLKPGYVADLCSDGGIAPCALILGLLYVKRLSQINPKYLLTISPTDLFLTTMVVASKYLQDEGEMEALVNSEWAEIGQRSKSTVDALEKDFLSAMDWRLFVSQDEYYKFALSLEARIAVMEASRRGWWSYTDLATLWEGSDMPQVMTDAGKQTAKVASGSMAAYLVCLTTLMATTHLVHVTMDTSSSTNLSHTMNQPQLLTLLHRVDMDSDWKEVTTDFPASKAVWDWSGFDLQYTSIQEWKNCIGSENLPQFTCDYFVLGGLNKVHYGTGITTYATRDTSSNKTSPLNPPYHQEYYQRNEAPETYNWHSQYKDLEWIEEGLGDQKQHVGIGTIGTGSPEPDFSNDTNLGMGMTGNDVPVVVCQEKSEVGSLLTACTLAS